MLNSRPGDAVIEFGNHRFAGKTIDQIAETDRGLLWLDKMLGVLPRKWAIYSKIKAYLNDPAIEKDLNDLLESRER